MSAAAQLDSVSKRLGGVAALAEVSLEIRSGEVVALLGPNGAGKTTAISILLGLRLPDRGRARLFGADPREPKTRRGVGVTPQEASFPPTVTVDEIIGFVRGHYECPRSTGEIADRFGLMRLRTRKAGGLSAGERRRLALALAFVGGPELVVLDEPSAGLDVEARHGFWVAIREFHEGGGAVLLTTHYLEEAEALAQRVVLLNTGRVIANGSVREVADTIGVTQVRFEAPAVPILSAALNATREGSSWTIDCRDADGLVRELVRANVPFRGLEIRPVSLEQAFLALTDER
jgi:ABC-2 type transport system ATP-binding protein